MILDASGTSVRAALREAMTLHLRPHQTLTIDRALDAHSRPVSVRTLQIVAAQVVTPMGWKVFTERNGDSLTIYRWS